MKKLCVRWEWAETERSSPQNSRLADENRKSVGKIVFFFFFKEKR